MHNDQSIYDIKVERNTFSFLKNFTLEGKVLKQSRVEISETNESISEFA